MSFYCALKKHLFLLGMVVWFAGALLRVSGFIGMWVGAVFFLVGLGCTLPRIIFLK